MAANSAGPDAALVWLRTGEREKEREVVAAAVPLVWATVVGGGGAVGGAACVDIGEEV